ncbi:Os08g0286100 [Oryza sativa Japonica Group]|uniref:Pectate lyase n=2 Tax=Oryza sativa subsp. japonica TaxID=39947 RepID=A0A0P0XED9_ORYSJ|nr:Os08g0286100 [Oryza sativa Japonica Group]
MLLTNNNSAKLKLFPSLNGEHTTHLKSIRGVNSPRQQDRGRASPSSIMANRNVPMLLPLAVLFLLGSGGVATAANVIDRCWRGQRNWAADRQRLAVCSVGFAGKMRQNRGAGVVAYTVTDPSDDPVRPRPGTLRYGATVLPAKVWITFARDMRIRLAQPLYVKNFTTIDGRGADVHVAGGAGIVLYHARDVIVHGLHVHDCRAQPPGRVVVPGGAVQPSGSGDGDAIRLVASSKVWIDHNTLSRCEDGLLDVTVGSTDVTVSNNWFHDHDKVMLLGHDDGFTTDRRMRVTVAFNRFGPNVNQRMPRIRHGYAHVVNNLYDGWRDYAIGGSMGPSVKSQGNLFAASGGAGDNKKVTRRMPAVARGGGGGGKDQWHLHSVGDAFENGAFFRQVGNRVRPNYNRHQAFSAASAGDVRALTGGVGALTCSATAAC